MDHIFLHTATTLKPVQVPLVCKYEDICDKAQFFQWSYVLAPQLSLEEFASQVQSWLYFGLLSAFLSDDIPPKLVLKQDPESPGREWLDSCAVGRLIESWYDSNRAASANEEYHEPRQVTAAKVVFSYATLKMNEVVIPYLWLREHLDAKKNLWSSEPHAVIYAVDVLLDMLSFALERLPHLLGARDLERRSLAANVQVYRDSIVKRKRCPSLGWRLQPSSTEWYRILYLPSQEGFRGHQECRGEICLHTNPPSGSIYKTRHLDTCDLQLTLLGEASDNNCGFVKTDQEILKECIMEDHIPLICCYEEPTGRLRAEVVKGNLLSDYTAISHVWAGGLGNPVENALPECQIRNLMKIIGELPLAPRRAFKSFGFSISAQSADQLLSWASSWRRRPALFWIDTLCIPVADEYKDQRKKAIDSMAQIYAGARKVLVLDPNLQLLPTDALLNNFDTIWLYIKISPWMSRSWPLQEGAVAQNLCFRLRDEAIILQDNMYRTIGLPSLRMLQHNTLKHSTLRHIYDSRFTDAWNGLVKRSTKEPKDLHGIFATMVNLSAKEILMIPTEKRMMAIIRAQARVPLTLLYQPNDAEHDFWVPQFPRPESGADIILNLYGDLLVTDEGLVVNRLYETFALLRKGNLYGEGPLVLLVDRVRYCIRPCGPILKPDPTPEPSTPPLEPPETLFLLTTACFGRDLGRQGARFSVLGRDESGIRLRFEAPVSWTKSANVSESDGIACEELVEILIPDYRILVVLDIRSWPELKWARNTAFPFSTLNDNYGSAWILSTFAAWGITWSVGLILQYVISGRPLIQQPRFAFWKSLQPTDWLVTAFMTARAISLSIERGFWTRWLTEFAQQRWAASFYLSDLAERLLRLHHPPLLTTLPTHIPSFIVGAAILLYWPFTQQTWMLCYGGCLIAEPFVRLACQALVRTRGMVIWTFLKSEEGERWTMLISWAVLFIASGGVLIRYGAYYKMYWMIWLGGGFLIAYVEWLWIDLHNDYSRRLLRWPTREANDTEEEVEFEYVD